jgi:hypothetical protein
MAVSISIIELLLHNAAEICKIPQKPLQSYFSDIFSGLLPVIPQQL